jgi:serine/threonine protein kinase
VCLYEFLTGENPFFYITTTNNDADVDKNIISRQPDYSLIKEDDGVVALLKALLKKNPSERLGSSGNKGGAGGWEGVLDVMQHVWFEGIDWDCLDTMEPPWFPENEINMKDQCDIGDFKDAKDAEKVVVTEEDQQKYSSWSYVSQSAFQKEVLEFLLYEEIRVR